MKCYFCPSQEIKSGWPVDEWIKGEIYSLHGGRSTYFQIDKNDKNNVGIQEVSFENVEVIFSGNYFTVTGYLKIGEGSTYKLASVDVSGGWVKPHERVK